MVAGPTRLSPEVEAQVVSLYQRGQKLSDISSETGVARSSIYWVLQKNGIQADRIRRPERAHLPERLDELDRRRLSVEDSDILRDLVMHQQEALGELRGRLRSVARIVRMYQQGNIEAGAASAAAEAVLGVFMDEATEELE